MQNQVDSTHEPFIPPTAPVPATPGSTHHSAAHAAPPGTAGLQMARMSRRNVLSVAGIGVAAAAAGGAVSYFAAGHDAASNSATTAATGPAPALTGPVVVYVENLKTGDLEILIGTTQRKIRDMSLATQIARAAG